MMKFGERLREMRTNRGLSVRKTAELLDVSTVAYSHWENNSRNPNMENLIAMSALFGVSIDRLLGLSASSDDEVELVGKYRKLDHTGQKLVRVVCSIEYERVSVGSNIVSMADHRRENQVREIPCYFSPAAAGVSTPVIGDDFEMMSIGSGPAKADFAVRIQGDSMSPYIEDGQILFVQKTDSIENEEVGIFMVDGSAYCKQYYKAEDGTLYLLSANEQRKNSNVILSPESGSSITLMGRALMPHTVSLPDYFVEFLKEKT